MSYTEPRVSQGGEALDPYKLVPSELLEQAYTRMFPHVRISHLYEMRDKIWTRMGVATAIVNRSGEILMLEHAESAKLSEGATGPLMETSRLRLDREQVETTEQTIYRALVEELGIEEPGELDLRARLVGAWTLHNWPAGDKNPSELVLGINPVVVIPDDKADRIGRFIKTEEVRKASFKSVEEIANLPNLRLGVLKWLGGLTTARGLLDTTSGDLLYPLNFDLDGMDKPGWRDVVFSEI